MIITLACGCRAIMTARASARHLGVIHCTVRYRGPFGRRHRMARFANVSARYMRCALAAGVSAIVTANTVSGNATMIDRRP